MWTLIMHYRWFTVLEVTEDLRIKNSKVYLSDRVFNFAESTGYINSELARKKTEKTSENRTVHTNWDINKHWVDTRGTVANDWHSLWGKLTNILQKKKKVINTEYTLSNVIKR